MSDPMRDVFGAGEISHPNEILAYRQELDLLGVKVIEKEEEKLAYSPALRAGKPGTVYISKGASYSAWIHEYTHYLDDKNDGYLGLRVFKDVKKCIERETHAYNEEIKLAKQAGRLDIVERLEKLKRKEVARYE